MDDVQAEFQLYATNGFMPKTDAEKLHEIERIKYLLDTYPDQFKQVKGGGRTVEKIARILNMGKTTVGDYVTSDHIYIKSYMDIYSVISIKSNISPIYGTCGSCAPV